MDSRTAAHVLSQIAAYLELRGESRFKVRAYEKAAKGLMSSGTDDLAAAYRSGEIGRIAGIGPATLAVVRDLVESGESRYLEQLREATPEGLLEMLRVPGLGPERIHLLHETLGIQDLEELEVAALDGRLASLPRWGPKTAGKILEGIAFLKESGTRVLWHHGAVEGRRLVAMVRQHPAVARAEVAGSVRRHLEVVRDVDIVAACTSSPDEIAESFTRISGVRSAERDGCSATLHFVDGTRLDLHCVPPERFAVAWWRATGSAEHEAEVADRLAKRGMRLEGDTLVDRAGATIDVPDEAALYAAAGLGFVEPELREGRGEVDAAARRKLPRLVELADIRGVLHCHTTYSDGKASVAEMAQAARARGWSYIGITDHSQAAFYAGGLSRDQVLGQHEEIDALNETLDGVRVLKGIEADILADGRLDYDEELLATFDFVVGSIHSRFNMDQAAMTERVLTALENRFLTVLAHPTGRLLLSREPYGIDLDAVIEKAVEVGVAVELNADPHRLDLDWRRLHDAKARGATIEIGPDAHSPNGLDNVAIGIGMARKGWLEASDVLNARGADEVLAFAARRRGR